MAKFPLQLKFATASGILGGLIGSFIGAWYTPGFIGLSSGFLLGYIVGFVGGYRFGGLAKTLKTVALAENLSSGIDTLAILLGFAFAIAGSIALVLKGWDLRVFFSILFFLIGSLYLAYKRFR